MPARRLIPPLLRGLRPGPARRVALGLTGLAVVLVVGTAGYMLFGYGLLDAAFQTVITITTVGFEEVHRFSGGVEAFTVVLILVGVGTAAYTFSMVIETFVEGQIGNLVGRRRMERRINAMDGHVILCGWGRVGRAIARYLLAQNDQVVVVDQSMERLETATCDWVHGDATDDAVLRAAGIDRARVLVTALNADADNLYVTLTGRSMRPDLFIVARSSSAAASPKLLQAGADRVVDPQDIGGARMAALAVQPHVAEFLDVVMHDGSLEFRLEQVQIPDGSPMAGHSLRSARIHDRTGVLVLAMRDAAGAFRTNPGPEDEIPPGSVLIVIGTAPEIDALRTLTRVDGPLAPPSRVAN